MTRIASLRSAYFDLTDHEPDASWKSRRLEREITNIEEHLREATARAKIWARQDAEEAQRQAEYEERVARIEYRGDMDEYLEKRHESDDERHFAYRLRSAQADIAGMESAKQKFAANMEQNPVYALEWADSLYEATAKYQVAQELIAMWEKGYSHSDWTQYAVKELARAAQSGGSTSTAHNHMSASMAKAWAHAVRF